MAGSLHETLGYAWKQLWDASAPYHFPTITRRGAGRGTIRVRALKSVTFPDTGHVVLFNREPWGGVSINLKDNTLSQLHTAIGEGIDFDPATGKIQAKLRFSELKYTGNYIVQRDLVTGSALKLAGMAMKSIQPGVDDPGDDPNVTLAKSYQSTLVNLNDNGRMMVGTYYDHNEAYCQVFTNTVMLAQWQKHQTNGQNTAYYASQTSAAAQNTGTVVLNPPYTPGGNTAPYNDHSFFMQILVVATCNAQCNCDAAYAASNFKSATLPVSQPGQNVGNVLTTVTKNSTPTPVHISGCTNNQCPNDTMLDAEIDEPDWMLALREKAAPIVAAIQKEEEDVRCGIKLRETTGRPIPGRFREYIATPTLTFSGSVRKNGAGEPIVEFASVSGDAPLVNIKMGAFPGKLFPEVEAAVDKTQFLKSVLGKRVVSALGSREFLRHMGRVVTLAAGNKLD